MQIRNFLDLVGYYHRFILNFSKITKPMTKLLEKDVKFKWSLQCEVAFLTLKNSSPFHLYWLNLILRSPLMCIVMHLA
jgi:hypothetical protein